MIEKTDDPLSNQWEFSGDSTVESIFENFNKPNPKFEYKENLEKRDELKDFLQTNKEIINPILQEQNLWKRAELLHQIPWYHDHITTNKRFIDLILRACNKGLDIARNDDDKKINLEILQSTIDYDTNAVIPHSIAWFTYMTDSINDKMFKIGNIKNVDDLIEYVDEIINKKTKQ